MCTSTIARTRLGRVFELLDSLGLGIARKTHRSATSECASVHSASLMIRNLPSLITQSGRASLVCIAAEAAFAFERRRNRTCLGLSRIRRHTQLESWPTLLSFDLNVVGTGRQRLIKVLLESCRVGPVGRTYPATRDLQAYCLQKPQKKTHLQLWFLVCPVADASARSFGFRGHRSWGLASRPKREFPVRGRMGKKKTEPDSQPDSQPEAEPKKARRRRRAHQTRALPALPPCDDVRSLFLGGGRGSGRSADYQGV